ncbi:transposase [Crenothrix sp.]|uniref:transposase n=1 Tax=Crenothrix sp. TaxID=3100433 RepID=UPI00374D3B59
MIPVLGLDLDEIALKKGHKDFVVIVSAINAQGEKHILAVLPDRKKDTVKAFLASIPVAVKTTIQRACVDMYMKGIAMLCMKNSRVLLSWSTGFMLPKTTRLC